MNSELSAICNHCVVMTAWSCKTRKFCGQFCVFFGETTSYDRTCKILFQKFTWRHRLPLLCSNVVKFVGQEIGVIVRYLPDEKTTQFRLPLKLSLLRGSRPKSARASPQQCAYSALNFIQIGYFRRSYSRTLKQRLLPRGVFPWFSRKLCFASCE